jgi:predicted RecA/RadA family phage recombinase
MHKIDTAGATAGGEFQAGTLGGTGTVLGSKWLNSVQRELLALLTEAALTPSATDDDQVLEAIEVILGRRFTVVAPYAVVAGDGVLVQHSFGVAAATAAMGASVAIRVTGTFQLPKVGTDVFVAGQRAYWDAAQKKITTTSSGNTLVGAAAEAKASGPIVVKVRLNPTTIP